MRYSIRNAINKFFKPSFINFKLILKDILNLRHKLYSNNFHLKKAINWLVLAQKMSADGGVSASYSLFFGWQPSYPETSGYIIPTLLDYYKITRDKIYRDVSKQIVEWECEIQLENGAFQGNTLNKKVKPTIFNTGQVIFGLVRGYKEFQDKKYLDCAIKAGSFLLENMDDNGNWKKFTYNNIHHTYNVRVAWALLELYLVTKDEKYKTSAIRNLEWALKQIDKNFWIRNNAFKTNQNPFLHTISYSIRGFLESGIILEDNRFKEVALKASEQLLNSFKKKHFLSATYNSNWYSTDYYRCLVGEAQLSIIWLKLYQLYKNIHFFNAAITINQELKKNQVLDKYIRDIDGAVKGSHPIWGKYLIFSFPNWATKFFCDTLILENKILNHK